MKKWWFILFLIIGLLVYKYDYLLFHPDTQYFPKPTQRATHKPPFLFKGATIEPLKKYRVRGQILNIHEYHKAAPLYDLSPIDVALGWGPYSSLKSYYQLNVTHSNRGAQWNHANIHDPNVPFFLNLITKYSNKVKAINNTHLIPATDAVYQKLKKAKNQDILDLEGYLVSCKFRYGSDWSSSTTRFDIGNGACEIMYVEKAHVYPRKWVKETEERKGHNPWSIRSRSIQLFLSGPWIRWTKYRNPLTFRIESKNDLVAASLFLEREKKQLLQRYKHRATLSPEKQTQLQNRIQRYKERSQEIEAAVSSNLSS